MPLAVLHSERSKILIPRDDDAVRLERPSQNLFVTGIRSPFPRPQYVVAGFRNLRRKLRRETVVDQKSHSGNMLAVDDGAGPFRDLVKSMRVLSGPITRHDRGKEFVTDDRRRVQQASADILRLEPVVFVQQALASIPCRKHLQDVLDCEAMSSNDGLSAIDLRIERNPFEQLVGCFHAFRFYALFHGAP